MCLYKADDFVLYRIYANILPLIFLFLFTYETGMEPIPQLLRPFMIVEQLVEWKRT
jgi:hypothetical protein